MEMQISNAASEFPLYHSMATGPHSFQLPGAIPPVSTIPSYKNTMFPDRLSSFYYDSAGLTHPMPPSERCDRCLIELSVAIGGAGHHFGKKLCGMCAAKEQQQVSPKTEILDLDSQQVMSQQQQQQQQQQQDTTKAFSQHVVVPQGYDRSSLPPPPPAVEWPGYFQPQQNTLSGEHLSPDYNNVTTTTTTPPTMMGGSPPSDMQQQQQQQQQYQTNFDSGGGYAVDSNQQPGGGGGSGTKGNGSWKSNEARRAKTYECPACDKWFTSSGHLKRHYGTQLHKNAVKQSGKPDPAILPMKHHYHPYRDPAYVAQQKLKQQQQNGGGHKQQQQQQSSMMQMSADFRPVTSTSSFNTDSFLELTPPNLTASLSDSLGGTQYLPARRPVSNSSSSSNSSTAGFTDAIPISSYHNSSSNTVLYPADRMVHRLPATLYRGHQQSTVAAVQQARSAYQHRPNTDTIHPYTTQVSMTQPITNTDSYITMQDNNGGGIARHLYDHRHHHQHHHHQQPPGAYHHAKQESRHHLPPGVYHHVKQEDHQQHQAPVAYHRAKQEDHQQQQQQQPPVAYHRVKQEDHQQQPPVAYHRVKQEDHQQQQQPPVAYRRAKEEYQPSATLSSASPYSLQQQQYHMMQPSLSNIKSEPVDFEDASMASPDSSIIEHPQQQYKGLLVVTPISSTPPPVPPAVSLQQPDDDAAVSDSSGGGSVDLDNMSLPPSPPSATNKKLRKTTRVSCELCNKDFTDKCYKTQHDQRFHSGEKPYRCGLCGKRFGEHRQLEVHELRHNDSNKAFPCTVCTKSFNFKNDLDRHFMSSHSTEKPYQCVQCKKKFVRLDHKRHHEKTHGGAVDKTKKKRKVLSDDMVDVIYGQPHRPDEDQS